MRRYLLFIFLLYCLACTPDRPSIEDRLMADMEGYIAYREADDQIKDEQLWELEWFQTLSRSDQYYLVDSIPGFDHLRPYLLEFDDVYKMHYFKIETP